MAEYGGLDVSERRRIKELESENVRLKMMYAEPSLRYYAMQDAVDKKAIAPAARSELVTTTMVEHGLSIRRVCRAARLARTAVYVPWRVRDDGTVIAAIESYVHDNPRHGFDKLYPALRDPSFRKCRLYRFPAPCG
jgi:putative transposase